LFFAGRWIGAFEDAYQASAHQVVDLDCLVLAAGNGCARGGNNEKNTIEWCIIFFRMRNPVRKPFSTSFPDWLAARADGE